MSKKQIIAIIVAVLGIGGFAGYHMHTQYVAYQRIIQLKEELKEEEKAAREAEKKAQEEYLENCKAFLDSSIKNSDEISSRPAKKTKKR